MNAIKNKLARVCTESANIELPYTDQWQKVIQEQIDKILAKKEALDNWVPKTHNEIRGILAKETTDYPTNDTLEGAKMETRETPLYNPLTKPQTLIVPLPEHQSYSNKLTAFDIETDAVECNLIFKDGQQTNPNFANAAKIRQELPF